MGEEVDDVVPQAFVGRAARTMPYVGNQPVVTYGMVTAGATYESLGPHRRLPGPPHTAARDRRARADRRSTRSSCARRSSRPSTRTTSRPRAAWACSDGRILRRHALPNAMLPTVTLVAINLGYVVAGAITVEVVFNWPGLGTLTVEALAARDYPVLQGIFLLLSRHGRPRQLRGRPRLRRPRSAGRMTAARAPIAAPARGRALARSGAGGRWSVPPVRRATGRLVGRRASSSFFVILALAPDPARRTAADAGHRDRRTALDPPSAGSPLGTDELGRDCST